MTMKVRSATLADVNEVRLVGFVAWPHTYEPLKGASYVIRGLDTYWNAEAITEAIEQGTIDVAESSDGNIIGMTHVDELGTGDLVMWKLYVLPRSQGEGVGRALVEAAKNRARVRGSGLITEYDAENERVRDFYLREGFEPTLAPWTGTDAVWLRWIGS